MKIRSADFIKSAKFQKDYEDSGLPEIAFAGRSNVGKSSLINSLCRRNKLVKVSGTPGRTQLLNFFRVNDVLSFVDLPGYGYAKVPKKEKKEWAHMIETYLEKREELVAVVCILDARRGIEPDDMLLIESAPFFGWQPIVVFTKSDKFKKNARANRRRELAKELGCKPDEVLMYSSESGDGREELWDRICEVTGIENEDDSA